MALGNEWVGTWIEAVAFNESSTFCDGVSYRPSDPNTPAGIVAVTVASGVVLPDAQRGGKDGPTLALNTLAYLLFAVGWAKTESPAALQPAEAAGITASCDGQCDVIVVVNAHTESAQEIAAARAAPGPGGDESRLESLAIDCCSPDHLIARAVTMVVASRFGTLPACMAESGDEETAAVLDLQFYMWCLQGRYPTPSLLLQEWDSFYQRCQGLVQGVVQGVVIRRGQPVRSTFDAEDVAQEVWQEVLLALPALVYDRSRGSLSAWLAGVAKRKAQRLSCTLIPFWARNVRPIEEFAEGLASSEWGPQETCLAEELNKRVLDAKAALRRQVSPRNYRIFYWRFFLRRRIADIAAALNMSRKAVARRYDRVNRVWRELTRDLDLSGCGGDLRGPGEVAKSDAGAAQEIFRIPSVPPENSRGIFRVLSPSN